MSHRPFWQKRLSFFECGNETINFWYWKSHALFGFCNLTVTHSFSVPCFCWERKLIEPCKVFVQSYVFARSVCQVSKTENKQEMFSLLGNPNVPEACCLSSSKFSILLLWIFPGPLLHTSAPGVAVSPTEILSSSAAQLFLATAVMIGAFGRDFSCFNYLYPKEHFLFLLLNLCDRYSVKPFSRR